MPELAIIICAYAPMEEVFSRTLAAVRALTIPEGVEIECVIVDNNNDPPLESRAYVREFLGAVNWARVICESRQGLSHARMSGIGATRAPAVIFFDDDNEPAVDYLVQAARCLADYRDVYAWGPGRIDVAFDPQVPHRLRDGFLALFQHRDCEEVRYGCVPGRWEDYYPYGTGLVVRREVLDRYAQRVLRKELGAIGRTGKKLGSAEDLQIVWEAVLLHKAAGISPTLKMTHIVPAHRATPAYAARLLYGTGASYLPALVESFPDARSRLSRMRLSGAHVAIRLLKIALRSVATGRLPMLRVELARFMGPSVGLIDATSAPGELAWVRRLALRLGLE
ncbi:MAG: glycosyltransferase [Pseudomonadota bacterium]